MSDFSYYVLAVALLGVPLWIGMVLELLKIVPLWAMYASVFLVMPWSFVFRRWVEREKKKEDRQHASK